MQAEPRVYQLVSQERIRDILTSFNACFNLPIQLLDEDGAILMRFRGGDRLLQNAQEACVFPPGA